ncbi:NPC intracellular cholesterol transporter 2-like [Amblyraja radiata]|uniref:NPC intracellular cholesterol transporter 2-like n=1 Tax=Amblyraja radiata TaxID=386614 RepID=UPI00140326A2|nr:NPC intracellular cholesterol transporter 2-like [Amblyraja radiata]
MGRRCCVVAASLLLLGLVAGEPVKYQDCGSESGKLIVVDVSPCPSLPCKLIKEKTYDVNVTFVSLTDTLSSKAEVRGILAGLPVPFNLPNDDGCKSGIHCPIRKNQKCNYINTLLIKSMYPSIKLEVEWMLKDDKGKKIFCWIIPVEISS